MELESEPFAERDKQDWRLRTIFHNGKVSKVYFTLQEMEDLGMAVIYETDELIVMTNETGIEVFVVDKEFRV